MIHWQHFKQLNEIKDLTMDKQVKMYNQYVNEFQYNMYAAWLNGGGARQITEGVIGVEGFLQQENLSYIIQENGSKIKITQ